MTTEDRIREYLLSGPTLRGAPTTLPADYKLLGSVLDSLGILSLVTYLESEFGIEIMDDELLTENFSTIANIVVLVEAKRTSATP